MKQYYIERRVEFEDSYGHQRQDYDNEFIWEDDCEEAEALAQLEKIGEFVREEAREIFDESTKITKHGIFGHKYVTVNYSLSASDYDDEEECYTYQGDVIADKEFTYTNENSYEDYEKMVDEDD